MDWLHLVQQILEVCVIPLLGVLTAFAVNYIKIKGKMISEETNNEVQQKYIDLLTTTISDCVIATNQTFVESLKAKGEFTKEAAKEAFEKTSDTVQALLTEEAKKYLSEIYGDLNAYISTQIEVQVNLNK